MLNNYAVGFSAPEQRIIIFIACNRFINSLYCFEQPPFLKNYFAYDNTMKWIHCLTKLIQWNVICFLKNSHVRFARQSCELIPFTRNYDVLNPVSLSVLFHALFFKRFFLKLFTFLDLKTKEKVHNKRPANCVRLSIVLNYCFIGTRKIGQLYKIYYVNLMLTLKSQSLLITKL